MGEIVDGHYFLSENNFVSINYVRAITVLYRLYCTILIFHHTFAIYAKNPDNPNAVWNARNSGLLDPNRTVRNPMGDINPVRCGACTL